MSAAAIEFRILTASDLPVLEHVDADVFDHPIQPGWAARFLSNPDNVLAVAIQERMVIGMASAIAYVHPDKPLQLFINEVGVRESSRGQGVGSRLLEIVLEHGISLGCTEAWVATEEHNIAARALYSAMNGTEESDRAVVFTWKLDRERHVSAAARGSSTSPASLRGDGLP